jgi:hypothetical protein
MPLKRACCQVLTFCPAKKEERKWQPSDESTVFQMDRYHLERGGSAQLKRVLPQLIRSHPILMLPVETDPVYKRKTWIK